MLKFTRHETAAPPSVEKWGEAALGGFQQVPDLLLKNQAVLKISPSGMVVLLNVLMHWWYRDQKPFPRPTTIARRMGVTVRTVQRALRDLEDSGLLVRAKGTNDQSFLDPEPLVQRLAELAQGDKDYQIRTGKVLGPKELETASPAW